MKKLEDILKQKNSEKEIEERKFQEIKSREIEQEKKELIRQNELKKEEKNKASINYALNNALLFGFLGLLFGAIIGFGEGCISYGDKYAGHSGHLSEPFIYIPENALKVCIIGAIIGAVYGFIKGQNK